MKTFNSIEEILDFAIAAEQRAVDLYIGMVEKSSVDDMKEVFMEFAKEEMSHKARILKIKNEGVFDIPSEKIKNPDGSGLACFSIFL